MRAAKSGLPAKAKLSFRGRSSNLARSLSQFLGDSAALQARQVVHKEFAL